MLYAGLFRYLREGHDKDLESVKERISQLERRTDNLNKQKDSVLTQINAIRKELSNQKVLSLN